MISGVLQALVLEPLLFVIFINDINKGIISKISKFADNTKSCKDEVTKEDVGIMREDLRRAGIVYEWDFNSNTSVRQQKRRNR